MTALFPHAGENRDEQQRAEVLARRLRDVVSTAILSRVQLGARELRLDVRVSRRAGVGPCIILHRVYPDARREVVRRGWLPWSWPLTCFTTEDAVLLDAGIVPEIVLPCVLDWSATLRTPSPDPKVTV